MTTTKICPVCHTKYESGDCPVCKFPDIAFPGDPEEGLRLMKPQIDAYREVFLLKLKIGVVSYYWKDQNGSLVLDREQITPLGTAKQLSEGPVWLSQSFARLPDAKQLEVQLSVELDGETKKLTVNLPKLLEPELQQIGAELDNEFCIRVMLRNRTSNSASERIHLFA